MWAVILFVGTFFLPESPRFLMEKGRNEEALRILQKFRRQNDEEFMKKEFKQMLDQINWDKENEVTSIVGILKKPSYRKRLILACG
jgi:3-methyladenine DNA glycosylase AlkC